MSLKKTNKIKMLYKQKYYIFFSHQNFHIIFSQGRDLAAKDSNGLSDPYVRVTLLPDKKHRLETKIKRRTLNPRWNETFYFEGIYS